MTGALTIVADGFDSPNGRIIPPQIGVDFILAEKKETNCDVKESRFLLMEGSPTSPTAALTMDSLATTSQPLLPCKLLSIIKVSGLTRWTTAD